MADCPEHPLSLMQQIESRQDELIRLLDELERKLETTIRDSQLKVVAPALPLTRAA